MNKICLVGFGNLGFRYFQAISKLKKNLYLYVIDINGFFKKGYEYQKKNKIQKNIIFLRNLDEIDEKKIDLVIIATTANSRLNLIEKIKKLFIFDNIIIEKPITQSETELIKLKKILPKNSWINTQVKNFKIYKDIKKKINPKNRIKMTVEGNSWGICCNSLHLIELFNYFCEKKISQIEETKKLKWVKSKRKNFFELDEGEIKINFNKNLLFLNSLKNKKLEKWNIKINIQNGNKKWEIYETNSLIVQIYNKKKTSHKIPFVSEYMVKIISNILNKNYKKIFIPNFNSSYILFKPTIRFFLKKWKEKNKNALFVPIT